MEKVFLQSPDGKLRDVEATAEALTPLLAAGWHQVPAPAADQPATPAGEEK